MNVPKDAHKHRWGGWSRLMIRIADGSAFYERQCLDCGKTQRAQNVKWSSRASKWVRAR